MLVPAQWQGSVEHFYHFFFGYFMPIALWLEKNPTQQVFLRDCGPMNPWLELFSPETEIEFIPAGVMLQRVLTNRQENQIFWGWDNPTHFQKSTIVRLRKVIERRLDFNQQISDVLSTKVTILVRKTALEFFESRAEVQGSGAAARSIPNLHSVSNLLADDLDVTFLETADKTPREQIEILRNTKVLVAQHGAGLSNMIWMKPGTLVIEIQPPLPQTIDSIFSNLAAAAGLRHTLFRQEHEHAEIDLHGLAQTINSQSNRSQFKCDSHFTIPKMPGSLPFRLVRVLPRSW